MGGREHSKDVATVYLTVIVLLLCNKENTVHVRQERLSLMSIKKLIFAETVVARADVEWTGKSVIVKSK